MSKYKYLAKRKAKERIFKEFLQSLFAFTAMIGIMSAAIQANESLLEDPSNEIESPFEQDGGLEGNDMPLKPGEEGENAPIGEKGSSPESSSGSDPDPDPDPDPNPKRNEEANLPEEEANRKSKAGKKKVPH